MKSKISAILLEIEKKKKDLKNEYINLMEKYGFSLKWWKIKFNSEVRKQNKKYKISVYQSFLWTRFREFLSIPFIYWMIIPAVFLDISLFIYQQTAFRLYKIPIVRKHDYIIYDRWKLDYLNWIQKVNCIYCTYVNGLFAYAVEVWWRTERYWCPIKHSQKLNSAHSWECDFADYWDPQWFKDAFIKDKVMYKKLEE